MQETTLSATSLSHAVLSKEQTAYFQSAKRISYSRTLSVLQHLTCWKNPHSQYKPTGRTIEDQVTDLMQMFAKRKFVRKTERKFKTPKPGRKRLVKFPRTLELCQVGNALNIIWEACMLWSDLHAIQIHI